MKKTPIEPAAYIDSENRLRAVARDLSQEPLLAVDTESNSLYAYHERICLFQVSTRTADYIIDPLAIADMQPLCDLFENPEIEKVFHAAEYDIMCMKRDYGVGVHNLFDTMLAARICGYPAVGLGSLLEQHAGIEVDKRHQRDNWGKRPLPKSSLLYAQRDTHYLPALRDILWAELNALDCLEEARELFVEVCHAPAANNHFDPEGYWRIVVPHNLPLRSAAILRELYLWREKEAEKRDCPPFKILTDRVLLSLTTEKPRYKNELFAVKGLSASHIRRYGYQVLRAIERGRRADLPARPEPQPPANPVVVERYTALHEWRKNRARERGVESDVIVSKGALWTIAQRAPNTLEDMQGILGLGPWRLAAYGDEILALIETVG